MKVIKKLAFGNISVDSSSKLRGDKASLELLANSPESINLIIWNGKILLNYVNGKPNICYLNTDHKLLKDCQRLAFLGFNPSQMPIFLYELRDWVEESPSIQSQAVKFIDIVETNHPFLPEQNRFTDLKKVLIELESKELSICGTAKSLYEWHKANKFCSRCGKKNFITQSGWELFCNSCNSKCFPRTDPVVIMLIENQNSILLGRSPEWPKGMYSCLAGFLEPGESIEDAVRRETFEEVGIKVSEVNYVSNQPWPFPHSLMIGCRAVALNRTLNIDYDELEHARWFEKEEIRSIANKPNAELKLARKGTIANCLIEDWLHTGI